MVLTSAFHRAGAVGGLNAPRRIARPDGPTPAMRAENLTAGFALLYPAGGDEGDSAPFWRVANVERSKFADKLSGRPTRSAELRP